jgi:pimeloyl-ACP methyl ester carboxylesterase
VSINDTTDVQIDPLLVELGHGKPALVLHGGGGPRTVRPIADHLQTTRRVLLPTHPGWDGTLRPEGLTTVSDLAAVYLDLLAQRGLTDVLVVGSSLGGWIAAEMAVQDRERRIARLVLIDSAGIAVPEEPFVDFFGLTPRQIAEHSFHDPDRFFVDPAVVPAEARATQSANLATMRVLAGDPYMHDPTLAVRLAAVRARTLVLWGASDRVFTPGYGRALAAAIPGAEFRLVPEAGHLPQLEQPTATFAAIDSLVRAPAAERATP